MVSTKIYYSNSAVLITTHWSFLNYKQTDELSQLQMHRLYPASCWAALISEALISYSFFSSYSNISDFPLLNLSNYWSTSSKWMPGFLIDCLTEESLNLYTWHLRGGLSLHSFSRNTDYSGAFRPFLTPCLANAWSASCINASLKIPRMLQRPSNKMSTSTILYKSHLLVVLGVRSQLILDISNGHELENRNSG